MRFWEWLGGVLIMDGSRLSSLVAVISLCALGAAGCRSDTSTRDGPRGDLNADNTFLFANSGPTRLHDGLGTHRFEVSTDSEEAQRYIDQGVAQVYGFQSADAYRSFRKASELVPRSPWRIGAWRSRSAPMSTTESR